MPRNKITNGTKEVERRHEQFILAYSVTGNAAAAAIAAGYSPKGARTEGSRLLAHPDVATRAREARDLYETNKRAAFDRQTETLRSAADQAILALVGVLTAAKSEMARVQAAIAVLDRAGHKPVERVESHNEHVFNPGDADEVDSRLDRIFSARTAGESPDGDSGSTH